MRANRLIAVPTAFLMAFAVAQSRPQASSSVLRPQVFSSVKWDTSDPLRDLKSAPATASGDADEETEAPEHGQLQVHPKKNGSRLHVSATARISSPTSSLSQPSGVSLATPGLNFDSLGYNGFGGAPSDSNGSVGNTQYVQTVNAQFAVYSKTTGSRVYGPANINTLWTGFGGVCETTNLGDPVVEYDKLAKRWIISRHASATGTPWYQCVAVSTTSDATGTFYRYAFQLPTNFPDYPKMAVWPDAYYLSINELIPPAYTNAGAYVCALDRNSMLVGSPATAQCFQLSSTYMTLVPADLDGATAPPAGSPNYLLNMGTNALNMWRFHVDWTNPNNTTLTGPVSIPVNAFSSPCNQGVCVPEARTSQTLDTVSDRLMHRLAYRNFGTYETLVINHTVSVSNPSRTGVRWYEIRNPGGTPTVYQQGTYAPDSNWRWLGSIAMDKAGDIALGFSVSSSTMSPAIRYTGRLATDSLGTMEAETSIIEGPGVQINGDNRWGDYSSMAIDPVDDCTFWYTNQYIPTDGSKNWVSHVASFSFPACVSGAPVSLSPSSLTFGPQPIGTSSTSQSVTLTNNESVFLNISSIQASGDFSQTNNCGTGGGPGQSCQILVTFTPTTTGTRTGTLTITDDASTSPQTVPLTGSGTGTTASLSPASLTFGSVLLGNSSSPKTLTLTNTGTNPVNSIAISISGDFSYTTNCSTTLAVAASCSINVTFKPTATGTRTGSVTVTDNSANGPHVSTLSGTGLNPVALSSTSLNFGSVAVGTTSAAKTVTLTNRMKTTLNIVSITVTGDYAQTNTCGSSVVAGGTCQISVTFTPTATGTRTGKVTIQDNAVTSPQTISLTGKGI